MLDRSKTDLSLVEVQAQRGALGPRAGVGSSGSGGGQCKEPTERISHQHAGFYTVLGSNSAG